MESAGRKTKTPKYRFLFRYNRMAKVFMEMLQASKRMNQKIHDLLILLAYTTACSGFYYVVARIFIRTVGFLGEKTKGSIGLRFACYFIVWMVLSAALVTPIFIALYIRRPADPAWIILLVLLFLVSFLPATHYIRKNMEVLYQAGYAKRR